MARGPLPYTIRSNPIVVEISFSCQLVLHYLRVDIESRGSAYIEYVMWEGALLSFKTDSYSVSLPTSSSRALFSYCLCIFDNLLRCNAQLEMIRLFSFVPEKLSCVKRMRRGFHNIFYFNLFIIIYK